MYIEFLIHATLTLFSFTSRLLDTHSLTSRHALPFFCTKFIACTHIHTNTQTHLYLDVRPEGLAINSFKAQV